MREAYQQLGGFAALPTGEDAALLASLRGCGFEVLATAETPVRTSARRYGRAPGGLAGNLRSLSMARGGEAGTPRRGLAPVVTGNASNDS